jgi:hypothetical protein
LFDKKVFFVLLMLAVVVRGRPVFGRRNFLEMARALTPDPRQGLVRNDNPDARHGMTVMRMRPRIESMEAFISQKTG